MEMLSYSAKSDETLAGDIDLAALHARTPASFSVKGLFHADLVGELPAHRWAAVCRDLQAPPANGRHVLLQNYPVRDYQRIIHAYATEMFADLGVREGFRQAGRRVFPTFAKSTLGRPIVALVSDPMSAILTYPSTYHLAATGGLASAKKHGPRSVTVRWDEYDGSSEFALGVLEGVVLGYGAEPVSHVTESPAFASAGGVHRMGFHEIHIAW